MTNYKLIDLMARLATCVLAARLLLGAGFGPGQSFSKVGPANARQAACVCTAGFSFVDGIRGARQIGPSKYPAGATNDLVATPLRPQRDLFGTPFGPPFLIQTGAKYENLPDFRRNSVRGTEVCTKRNVARQTGSWRRRAARTCGEAIVAPPSPNTGGPARGFVNASHLSVSPVYRGPECGVATSMRYTPNCRRTRFSV